MWNKDKHKEYRKLKRNGYTDTQLKKHFGDDIYDSGIYNKGASVLNFIPFINEIKITPSKVDYSLKIENSSYHKYGNDYIVKFESRDISYILVLLFYEIDQLPTYNIMFTTEEQYIFYKNKREDFIKKGYITNSEHNELKDVFERKTNYFDLFNVMRYITYLILDIYPILPKGTILSIGDTDIETKINLYRSIIKDSFNISEEEIIDSNNNHYFIYKIN